MRASKPYLISVVLCVTACLETSPDPTDSPDTDAADTYETSELDTEPQQRCWPNYTGEETCRAAGWTWHHDYATSYCLGDDENCPPPTNYPFCALPCNDASDCAGTTVPFCGRIEYWGGRDAPSCSPFKVCVPTEPTGAWDCYYRSRAVICPR